MQPGAPYLRGMSVEITIAPAGLDDITAIEQLVNSAYRGDSSRKGWTTEADLLDGIRINKDGVTHILEDDASTLLKVTTPAGKVVGVVQLELQGKSMYLGMLTVKPDLQNAGIGKKLIAAGEAEARKKGCTKMKMTVISVRQELIEWYNSKGYQPTGDRKPFPDDPSFGLPKQPLEFIVLEKDL